MTDIDLIGYTVTFEDDFTTVSCSLNGQNTKGTKTWFHLPPTGSAGNYSSSVWSSDCVDPGPNATLALAAAFWTGDGRWYTGQISSMDPSGAGFAQQYGYFSARVKMPNAGTGAWPGFWLLSKNAIPSNQGQRIEIDIFEWYGKDNTVAGGQKVQNVLHVWNADGSEAAGSGISFVNIPGLDPVNNWHIYGVLVKSDFITWYIDGVQTYQLPTPARHVNPLFLMIDYGLGGGWPLTGEPYASKSRSEMYVDWVKVYSLPAPVALKGYFQGNIDGILT